MKNYFPSMTWFCVDEYWTLELHTDKVSVACKGCGARPPEWESFKKIVNQMGGIISG